MTKKEAADFLGVSVRAIERYTKAGKLTVTYEKRQIGGTVGLYDDAEVQKLKESIDNPPAVKVIDQSTNTDDTPPRHPPTALARVGVSDFAEMLVTAFETYHTHHQTIVALTDKLVLTLAEAATLSGLSQSFLLHGIRQGTLPAGKYGRGWKVKRADLNSFVAQLPTTGVGARNIKM
jgi:excisionase family DNA binding protein